MGVNVKDIGLAIVGAALVEAYADKLKIKDPKFRYGAIAVGAGLAAYKGPKDLRPLFIGAAVAGGVKTVAIMFPKLLPGTTAPDTAIDPANGTKSGAGKSMATNNTIGRRTAGEMAQIREAVTRGMEQRQNGSMMNGPIMGPIMGLRRRRSIYG